MGVIRKTISYLKRNGIQDTMAAIMERVDTHAMDPMQRMANAYTGRPDSVCDRSAAAEEICFSLLVPTYETKEAFLVQLIDSVLGQTYRNLQLVIADASVTDQVERVVRTYRDDRIVYQRLDKNGGISENTNQALALADGEYIGLLDHDDVLEKDALYHVTELIMQKGCDMVYTDEDKMSADGEVFFEPNCKPDFNLDYLLSNNYICHFTVIRSALIRELCFRPAYDGAQDYDLFLRTVAAIMRSETGDKNSVPMAARLRERIGHVPRILYHWRAHENSTADNPESKRYAYEAGKRAVEDFLAQAGWRAQVAHSSHLGFYEVTYLPDIFAVKDDVAAVGTYHAKRGRVGQGPVLDGQECFTGMRTMYSGYLHRADLIFEAEQLPKSCMVTRAMYERREQEQRRQPGQATDRMLYVPPATFETLQEMIAKKTPEEAAEWK